jgi:hypothetical protein
MKKILLAISALALALCLKAETEQSVTVTPVDTKTYQESGKTVTERTVQIKERIAVSGPRTFKAAIFIANRIPKLDEKMAAFEDLVTARVTDLGFQVLSKEIVSDSLRKFDPQLASTPRPADSLDTKLAEQSSALRLAQGLGADYLLVASLTSVGTRQKAVNAYGVNRITDETTLRVTYKIIDGQTGATVTANADKVTYEASQSENAVEKSDDVNNQLMDEAAELIANNLKTKIDQNRISAPTEAAALAMVNIEIEAADLVVPDVRIDEEHTVQISASQYKVHPLNATVEVDGVAVGTAPGNIQVKPGFGKLRITRDGFKPWERTINAVNGQRLTVALELNPEGYARWKDATAFLNDLKNGAKLTDGQVEVLKGQAKMLSQSGYKVDTKDAPATNIFTAFGKK